MTIEIKPGGARERLLSTAVRLFGAEGIRGTGIDRLLEEAGVAKMSLYKHFGSKDALVLAALARRGEMFRGVFNAVMTSKHEPRARILGIFDSLDRWAMRPDFRGCPFINAAGEFGEASSPVRLAASEHKEWVRSRFEDLARDAGAADAPALARELAILFEGATVRAAVASDRDAAGTARRMAEKLIDESASGRD